MKKFYTLSLLSLLIISGGCSSKKANKAVSADGVSISYEVQGQGEPSLVFVHGWSCDREVWEYQVPYFSQNHKVVTIDLGGHGQSGLGRKQWTVQAYGDDVVSVIKKLDLKNVVLKISKLSNIDSFFRISRIIFLVN